MRGRKPQPTALRILRGNPGRRPIPTTEPAPPPMGSDAPPDFLTPEAQTEWARIAPLLRQVGVLTETDRAALVAYCDAWATWKEATAKIRQFGMVLKVKDGQIPVVSPYVKIAHDALTHMKALLIEFGMTPSSRARVHATPPVKASKWADAL
jgi:P27 family predicted phage terminase small subunit